MKVGIIRCQERSNTCAGSHDFSAIRDKTGEFKEYDTIELVGFDTCGGCGRNKADKILERALRLKKNGAEAIHLGVCMIYGCPFREIYEKELKEKVGLPIIKGTHHSVVPQIVGGYEVKYPASSWFR